MPPFDAKKYVAQERSRGVSDDQIYDSLADRGFFDTAENTNVDRGILGEVIPTAGAIVGGIIGSAGGPPGVIAGSAIGGSGGEYIQQQIEKSTGERQSTDTGQIVASGVISGVLPGVLKGVSAAAKPVLKPVASAISQAIKPKVLNVLGTLSGYPRDVVKKALERSPATIDAIKSGERVLNNVVKRAAKKIQELASKELIQSRIEISKLSDALSRGGAGQKESRQVLLDQGKNFVRGITNILRTEHNIGVKSGTELLFNRSVQPSRVVSAGDKNALQEGFKLVKSIEKNTSIKHIDAILERLIVLKSKTPVGSPTGTEVKSILNQMIGEVKGFVKQSYPQYGEILEKNLQKRILIGEMKELFGNTGNPSPIETSRITSRLLQLYNTGKLEIKEAIESTGKKVGEDISGAVSGTIMNVDDPFSFRAKNLGIRGITEKILEAIPRKGLDNFVATGKISGELLHNQVITALSKTLNISARALLQEIVNLTADKKTR